MADRAVLHRRNEVEDVGRSENANLRLASAWPANSRAPPKGVEADRQGRSRIPDELWSAATALIARMACIRFSSLPPAPSSALYVCTRRVCYMNACAFMSPLRIRSKEIRSQTASDSTNRYLVPSVAPKPTEKVHVGKPLRHLSVALSVGFGAGFVGSVSGKFMQPDIDMRHEMNRLECKCRECRVI